MIGEEADRGDDNLFDSDLMKAFKVREDIGFKPRLAGSAAAALEHEFPMVHTARFRDEPAGLFELLLIVAGLRHGERDAVRGEDDIGRLVRRKLRESVPKPVRRRF